MKMEQTGCSETSAYKIQKPGNYPEENIQHTEHGESLKSGIYIYVSVYVCMFKVTFTTLSKVYIYIYVCVCVCVYVCVYKYMFLAL
jgi:hypothetical protein